MARNGDGLEKALAEIPRAARGVLGRRAGARRRRDAEPVAREGRPRRRLLRARRAACAATRCTARSRCGGHFREEHQTEDGEALRDDDHFAYVAAWECTGDGADAGAAQGAARVRVRPPRAAELQVRWTSRSRSGARPARTTTGAFETYDVDRRQPRHVVPRDARRPQRAAHRRGHGADRLRPRLPRGHLRLVRR